MTERVVQGVQVPPFFYGTAWKEERTAELAGRALAAGFRAIDTANQRRHYLEAGVGEAVAAARAQGGPRRDELFLQTKFTFLDGQDHRLPYDPDADVGTQVAQSIESSLAHLQTTYVDSLVLHGPSRARGLGDDDRQAWRALETLRRSGKARLVGLSNVTLEQLTAFFAEAEVKPAFVQNRCFARTGWDRAVREFCRARGIGYQGFSLLTANARELHQPAVHDLARRHGRTVAQIVFRFALQAGMFPLTGTTSEKHMQDDLACLEFELGRDEMETVERCAG